MGHFSMNDRAVGLGESLGKSVLTFTPLPHHHLETSSPQGQSRDGNVLRPGGGPRLCARHSSRLPAPPELLVTKGLVKARGRHRERHKWKPTDRRRHRPGNYWQEAAEQQANCQGGEKSPSCHSPGPRIPAFLTPGLITGFLEAFPHNP